MQTPSKSVSGTLTLGTFSSLMIGSVSRQAELRVPSFGVRFVRRVVLLLIG